MGHLPDDKTGQGGAEEGVGEDGAQVPEEVSLQAGETNTEHSCDATLLRGRSSAGDAHPSPVLGKLRNTRAVRSHLLEALGWLLGLDNRCSRCSRQRTKETHEKEQRASLTLRTLAQILQHFHLQRAGGRGSRVHPSSQNDAFHSTFIPLRRQFS